MNTEFLLQIGMLLDFHSLTSSLNQSKNTTLNGEF